MELRLRNLELQLEVERQRVTIANLQQPNPSPLPPAKRGFREIVMRSPGRYEIALQREEDQQQQQQQQAAGKIYSVVQQSLPFLPDLLGPHSSSSSSTTTMTWDDVILQGLSIIVSTTGATDQAWHADGSHMSIHHHLPCHCLNIFMVRA